MEERALAIFKRQRHSLQVFFVIISGIVVLTIGDLPGLGGWQTFAFAFAFLSSLIGLAGVFAFLHQNPEQRRKKQEIVRIMKERDRLGIKRPQGFVSRVDGGRSTTAPGSAHGEW